MKERNNEEEKNRIKDEEEKELEPIALASFACAHACKYNNNISLKYKNQNK